MGRVVRMIPPGWQHPKNDIGDYIPILEGSYSDDAEEWDEGQSRWDSGYTRDYHSMRNKAWKLKDASITCNTFEDYAGPRPVKDDYMPEWPNGEAAMLVMYEDTSGGTPISPPFPTPEKLARWLADNNASAFADMTATYEEWLVTCKKGWAISAVLRNGNMISGVKEAALER